jgi:aspartate carbamoyltransferase catalytic subunit
LKFPQHLLGVKYLDRIDIENIFSVADTYIEDIKYKKAVKKILSGISVINLFFEDSTRTRVSFDLAEKKMGMDVVNFISSNSSMSKGESLLDTVKNIEAMKFDFIVVRHSTPGIPLLLSKHSSAKIINAGDGTNEHPTQALLDVYTLKKRFNNLENLKVCIAGDVAHSRVAMSNILALLRFNAKVSVCGPASFIPKYLEGMGVNIYTNIDEAIRHNNAIIMLRVQLERDAGNLLPSLNEYNKFYGLNEKRISINPKIVIMHPGPMNMNVEIDYNSSISKNSLIFEQVTNGIAIKCAILKLMNEA